MGSLEDRLKDAIDKSVIRDNNQHLVVSIDKAVEEIKQVFADEGYVTVDKRIYRDEYGRHYLQYTLPNEYVRVPQFSYMTGKEWYERFEEELAETTKHWLFESFDRSKVLEAAKKASGIDNG